MAVPKKKTSVSKKRMRGSHTAEVPVNYFLDDLGRPSLSHMINLSGEYKGRVVVTTREQKREIRRKKKEQQAQEQRNTMLSGLMSQENLNIAHNKTGDES